MAQHQVIVTYGVTQRTPKGWLSKAKAVGAATTVHAPQYTSILSYIQQLANDTAVLDKAESVAANRGKNEIKTRNAALSQVKKSMRAFLAGLQGLCDAAPDAAQAEALAVGAGASVKGATTHSKDEFSGKAIGNGAVHLYARLPAKNSRRIFWEWQMSTNGGKTWTTLATTNNADFVVQDLPAATMPSFRCRSTVKNVASVWSQAIVVHVL
jgi:hypothetical protein